MMTRARTLLSAAAALLVLALGTTAALADVRGPDVASYQHPYGYSINWGQAHASGNAAFAFVKATEGTNYTNPYFGRDWAGTAAEGIVHGAYHFARPGSLQSAVDQARFYVNTAGTMHRPGELPGVLDLEVTGGLSPAALIAWTHKWLDTVEQLTGRTPILYTYPYFWLHQMANSTGFARYPLWIASYGSNPPRLGGWSHWTFWQYSDHSSVPGIPGSGSVDMSVFNGSLAQLAAMGNGASLSHWRPSGHNPVGNLDIAGQWGVGMRIIGWAIDPDTVNPDYVHVYVDGSFVRRLWASTNRPDIGNLWWGDGPNHGYDVTLPVKPGRHEVCVYAINLGYGDSNPRFPCRTVDVQPTTLGRIDVAGPWSDGLRVIGWVIDSHVDGPATVKVTLDGTLVSTTTADIDREDIGNLYGVYGPNHGWDVTLLHLAPGDHQVCASASPFDADGNGTSLGCKTVTVNAASS